MLKTSADGGQTMSVTLPDTAAQLPSVGPSQNGSVAPYTPPHQLLRLHSTKRGYPAPTAGS